MTMRRSVVDMVYIHVLTTTPPALASVALSYPLLHLCRGVRGPAIDPILDLPGSGSLTDPDHTQVAADEA